MDNFNGTNYMKNQFCSYEIAKQLKELGFDEKCIASYYTNIKENNTAKYDVRKKLNASFDYNAFIDEDDSGYIRNSDKEYYISAPLWQQVIDWFREKYNLWNMIYPRDGWNYTIQEIDNIPSVFGDSYHKTEMRTYEEAEIECLKKLIEIVKKK